MSFVVQKIMSRCPVCKTVAFKCQLYIELPPDGRSDEITIQVLTCEKCELQVVGVYEESRRGALDSEAWEHTLWRVSALGYWQLKQAVSDCPAPGNWRCACAGHVWLGAQDGSGRWAGLPAELGARPYDQWDPGG